MNRMAPMIDRRSRTRWEAPRAIAAAIALPPEPPSADWMDDARRFAAGWVAGLVVFGTFLA